MLTSETVLGRLGIPNNFRCDLLGKHVCDTVSTGEQIRAVLRETYKPSTEDDQEEGKEIC